MNGSPDDQRLRQHLVKLLSKRQAHVAFDAAVSEMPPELQGRKPEGAAHTPWEILEHLRIAQWDILEFSRDPKHVSPNFPNGYWPREEAPPEPGSWDKSVDLFRSDLQAFRELVEDSSTDLLTPIPHGDGQTVLREVLVVADHNAYHLGELVLVRRLLGAWR